MQVSGVLKLYWLLPPVIGLTKQFRNQFHIIPRARIPCTTIHRMHFYHVTYSVIARLSRNCNGTRTHNHLVHKRKLVKYLQTKRLWVRVPWTPLKLLYISTKNLFSIIIVTRNRKIVWKHGSSTPIFPLVSAQNTRDQYQKTWKALKGISYLQELFMLLWMK